MSGGLVCVVVGSGLDVSESDAFGLELRGGFFLEFLTRVPFNSESDPSDPIESALGARFSDGFDFIASGAGDFEFELSDSFFSVLGLRGLIDFLREYR